MSDSGVVMLDPVRLSGLEVYLDSLAHGCVQCAGTVERALIGTGESAVAEVAELADIASWCRLHHGDVVRRRLIIEALPRSLPLPPLVFATRRDASTVAHELARRFERAFDAEVPPWAEVRALVDDLRRGSASPAFAGAFFADLGPDVARSLSGWLIYSFGAQPDASESRLSWLEGTRVEQAVVTEALGAASRRDELDQTWWAAYTGESLEREPADTPPAEAGAENGPDEAAGAASTAQDPDSPSGDEPDLEARLRRGLVFAGWGADVAEWVARAARRGKLAAFLGPVGDVASGVTGVLGLIEVGGDVVRGDVDTWSEVNEAYWELDEDGLSLMSVWPGPIGTAGSIGGAALPGRRWVVEHLARALLSAVGSRQRRRQREDRPSNRRRTYDASTGTETYGGGGVDSPYQSGPGGPLDPNMVPSR